MDTGTIGRDYGDGEVICREGEVADRMYVVQAGCVEVVRDEQGQEVRLAELGAGDIFGEMAIIDRKPRSATVRAKGAARVLTLDKRGFLRSVHEDPSLAYRILMDMSERIRRLDAEVVRLQRSTEMVRSDPNPPRGVWIVPPGRPDLCERLQRELQAAGTDPLILLDRRVAERRRRHAPHEPERRRADRRQAIQAATLYLSPG